MASIEKSVFISYRRKDLYTALAVYQHLTQHNYDVFFDYRSIPSGDFEQIIIGNIKARAHFLVILTPSALDRCDDPEDWLRREIETAITYKRNIIPLFFNGFSFRASSVSEKLFGELKILKKYNGLDIPAGYFDEAMERLRSRFLAVASDAVLHPIPDDVQKIIEEQQDAANKAVLEKEEVDDLFIQAENAESSTKYHQAIIVYYKVRFLAPQYPGVDKKIEELESKLKSITEAQISTRPDRLSLEGIDFYSIPAGSFLMGSADENEYADDDEHPLHEVNIPYNYWIAQFPVTNVQYSYYVTAVNRGHPIRNWRTKKDHPVVRVSNVQARGYCNWLNEVVQSKLPKGYIVRLPTEAEWEKAARGGDGRKWPWGNRFSTGDEIGDLQCNCKENQEKKTLSVDAYYPLGNSPYNIADMVGNVWEWTCSLLKPYPYDPKDGRENPKTPGERVIRGGSYDKTIESVRSACRSRLNPSFKLASVGFRVAVAPPILIR